jgi:hypothetical protein
VKQLSVTTDISAAPADVWAVLTDLASFPAWNPFITSADGALALGARLALRIQPPGGRAMTFRPTVTVLEDGCRLEWLGRLGIPGIFDGRHSFELTALPDGGTRLVQSETFTGVLVPFMRSVLDSTGAGFAMMNEALRERAEAAAREREGRTVARGKATPGTSTPGTAPDGTATDRVGA